MRKSFLLSACALAACSPQPANDAAPNGSATVDEAALPDDLATPSPVEDSAPAPSETSAPAPAPAPAPTPQPTPAPTPANPDAGAGSAQAAATLVERYYALIGERNYGTAWGLWGNGGRDSGMSRQAFANSFARYAEYHAEIGAPGRIDPGAGQRYVSVPVRVYGKLRDGNRPFNMVGQVILHRTIVDGASAEQRSWRIRSADLKERPGGPATNPPPPGGDTDNVSVARYRCMDGSRLRARFDPDNRQVTVSAGGKRIAVLAQQRTGSGIAYAARGYEFRGKGDTMTFTAPNKPPITCTAIH